MRDVLGIIFAFDDAEELRVLTSQRTVASVPFGGRYRVIDFMLSNMINSGVSDVGVILNDRYQSLMEHIGSGRDWDLSRKRGGVFLLPPFLYAEADDIRRSSPYRGKMDGLIGASDFITRSRMKYAIVADGNIVANIDLRPALEYHSASGADITAVCVKDALPSSRSDMHIAPDEFGRAKEISITQTPDRSRFPYAATGIWIMEKAFLDALIAECAAAGISDWGREVLQANCSRFDIRCFLYDGLYMKIASSARYFESNMSLLSHPVREALFGGGRPIYTKILDEPPARYSDTASVKNSLVADGCVIEGIVENSILFRGVRIAKGAQVRNSIVLQGGKIYEDAQIDYIVTDKDVTVSAGRRLSGHSTYPVFIAKNSVV